MYQKMTQYGCVVMVSDDVATAIICVGSFEGLCDVFCRLLYAVPAGAVSGSNIICLPESCY